MRKINPIYATVGIVATLVFAFAVCALFDWTIISYINNPYVDSPARSLFNQQYSFWFNGAMLAFGAVGTALILIIANTKLEHRLAVIPLFTVVIFIVGNLEDMLYFILGQGYFPSATTQWSWMPEASTVSYWLGFNGSWTTINQQVWSALWLFIVLPLGLVAILKFPRRKPR